MIHVFFFAPHTTHTAQRYCVSTGAEIETAAHRKNLATSIPLHSHPFPVLSPGLDNSTELDRILDSYSTG
jgi:hypothetical protein